MEEKIVNIALFDDKYFAIFATENFEYILDGYRWEANGKRYLFRTQRIYDKDILDNKIRKFNAIMAGATDDYLKMGIWKKIHPEKYQKWRTNMTNFIKNGGGYAGHCGGANLICKLYNKPETFYEKAIMDSNLEIVETKAYQKIDMPLIGQLIGHPPDALEGAAYPVYDGFGPNSLGMGGVPINFVIEDESHPIFKGYRYNTVKIFWGGGPGLIAGNNAKIILKYPDDIHRIQPLDVWEYIGTGRGNIGKWIGLIKSIANEFAKREDKRLIAKLFWKLHRRRISIDEFLIELYKEAEKQNRLEEIMEKIANGLYKAKDWNNLHRAFIVKRKGMAAIVEEAHGDGRIIISGPHTEDKVWDGGIIKSVDETSENCLWDGLMKWHYHSTPYFIKWILRREAAWVAGLDEDELPPIPEEYLEKEIAPIKPLKPQKREETFIEVLIRFFRRLFGK